MTKLISKFQRSHAQTEAEEFFAAAYPFPSVLTSLLVLGAGDIAIVVLMVASLG